MVVTQLHNIENPPVVFVFPKLKFIFLLKEIQIIFDNSYIKKGKCSSNLFTHKWPTSKFLIWKITDHNWKQLILVVNFIFGLRVNEIQNQTFLLDSHRTFLYSVVHIYNIMTQKDGSLTRKIKMILDQFHLFTDRFPKFFSIFFIFWY